MKDTPKPIQGEAAALQAHPRYVLELCKMAGEVDRFELVSATPSGSLVRFAVRWQ